MLGLVRAWHPSWHYYDLDVAENLWPRRPPDDAGREDISEHVLEHAACREQGFKEPPATFEEAIRSYEAKGFVQFSDSVEEVRKS